MEIHHEHATVTVVMRTKDGMSIQTFEYATEMVEHFIEKCEPSEEASVEYIDWLNNLRGIITSSIARAKRVIKSQRVAQKLREESNAEID